MNTNKIFKWAAGALCLTAAVVTTSCADSFLDREPDGYYATKDQIAEAAKWNPSTMLGTMNGVNTKLTQWRAGGSSNQDDFGQKSVDIATDLMSADMVFSRGCNYGWFRNDARLLNAYSTANRTAIIWNTYYRIIFAANKSLELLGAEEPENPEQKMYWAAAKTARAFAYYNLVINYARSYDQSKDMKILPLITSLVSEPQAPAKVSEIYDFILSELDEAYIAYANAANEGYVFSTIDMPNFDVNQIIKAYTLIYRGLPADGQDKPLSDYQMAYNAATKAITLATNINGKSILPAAQLYDGFNSVDNVSWLWGIDIDNLSTGGLCTFWGMMDYYTYSYAAAGDVKSISAELFNEIPDSDGRKSWFGFYSGANFVQVPSLLLPVNKFYDSGRVPMGDRNWRNDIHFFRIEEAYLLAAEAAVRMGDKDKAIDALMPLLAERDANKMMTLPTLSLEQLMDEIYFNWRVELWGEGKSLQTARRFKKTIERPSNDYYGEPIGPKSYNDKSFYFSIPRYDLENNPLMVDADIIQ